jgi:hypothetical protein
MTDIEILTSIARFQLYFMTTMFLLVIAYATIVIVSIVTILIKKRKLPESAKQIVEAISDASEKKEGGTITTNLGRVIKFKSPEERREARAKKEKRLLGLE